MLATLGVFGKGKYRGYDAWFNKLDGRGVFDAFLVAYAQGCAKRDGTQWPLSSLLRATIS